MTTKIRPFKGLQNGIKNLTELLEEANWAYEPTDLAQRQSYISETHGILFRSNLKDRGERWYSKLPAVTKGD